MTGDTSPATPQRVSVALCTCNGERFIREQLETILSQSCPVDEIIICDDASTDATAAIVQTFSASNPHLISWNPNPTRLGVTKNFEKAISLCTGDIIFLCDQDDRWKPEKVRTILDALEMTGAALAFSNAEMVDENLLPLNDHLWDSIWFNAAERRQMKAGNAVAVLLRHAIAAGCTLAFRSQYRPLLLPIPNLPHSHDIWITLLLACIGRIDPLDRDLIQYRLHGKNEVGMRTFGFLDQIRMAKQQLRTNTFAYLADLHIAAHDRLSNQTTWSVDKKVLELLKEKIQHSQMRHALPHSKLARWRSIASELQGGNYRRYSYGLKSVLQDLFLR